MTLRRFERMMTKRIIDLFSPQTYPAGQETNEWFEAQRNDKQRTIARDPTNRQLQYLKESLPRYAEKHLKSRVQNKNRRTTKKCTAISTSQDPQLENNKRNVYILYYVCETDTT